MKENKLEMGENMGKVKISELPSTTVVRDDDFIQIVQQNTNKKIELPALREGIITPFFTAEQWGAITSGITSSKVAQIDDKVDKTTQTNKIYGTTTNGLPYLYNQSSASPRPYSIPLRNVNGQIVAADPTENNHTVTKKYADDMFRGKKYLRTSSDEPFGFTLKDSANGPIVEIDGSITLKTLADKSKVRLDSYGILVYDQDGTYTGILRWTDLLEKIKS